MNDYLHYMNHSHTKSPTLASSLSPDVEPHVAIAKMDCELVFIADMRSERQLDA